MALNTSSPGSPTLSRQDINDIFVDPTLLEITPHITHNIDFTEPDNESNIIREGEILKAATFSKLIEQLTHPKGGMFHLKPLHALILF